MTFRMMFRMTFGMTFRMVFWSDVLLERSGWMFWYVVSGELWHGCSAPLFCSVVLFYSLSSHGVFCQAVSDALLDGCALLFRFGVFACSSRSLFLFCGFCLLFLLAVPARGSSSLL